MSPQNSFFYRAREKKKRFLREIIVGIFLVNILCYIVSNFFFFPIKITNNFYEPWIKQNKMLWVKVLNLKNDTRAIRRGDFIFINGFEKNKRKFFSFLMFIPFFFSSSSFYNELVLQRVIALPGEKIKIDKKRIYVDDKLIEMKFLNAETQNIDDKIFNRDYVKETIIPNNYIFVLNPNWQINNDSRKYSFLPIQNIIGKIYGQKKIIK